MDLNYLLFREQIALSRADRAGNLISRSRFQDIAKSYRTKIDARAQPGCAAVGNYR